MPETQGPSIQRLLADALRESTDLARKEFTLFRTEMSDNVRTIAMGLVMVIAAAVVSILALIWLTQALVDWLATKVDSHALAALIVGGALAVVAIILGLYGRSAMSKTSLAPTRTARSLQQDKDVLTERASG
jgi:sterol desaturase/sphingolipid hydroxylase (fatty acid hydroxylase superfamily)